MAKTLIIISFLNILILDPRPTYGSATEVCVNAIYVSIHKCKERCEDQLSCKEACSWDETQIVAKCSKIPSQDTKHEGKEHCKTQVYTLYEECAKECREVKSCVDACEVGYKAGKKYCKG